VVMQPGSDPELIVNGQPFTLNQLSAIFPTVSTAAAANTPSTTNPNSN
jgi:hypothetical protein